MKDHYRPEFGSRSIQELGMNWDGENLVPEITTVYQPVLARSESFSVMIDGKGDHITANSCMFVKQKWSSFSGLTRITTEGIPQYTTISGDNVYGSGEAIGPAYDDEAYANAYNKMSEQLRGSIDLSIDFAQRKQSVVLIQRIGTLVKNVAIDYLALKRQFKRLSYKNPKAAFKQLSGLWLEYQYGLKPTMQTIHDSVVRIRNGARHETSRFQADGKSVSRETLTVLDGNSLPVIRRISHSSRTRIVCIMNATDDVINQVGDLTSLNPANIIWELIPFSFVVDWFIDIGGYLRDLETHTLVNQNFVTGFRTDTYKGVSQADVIGSVDIGGGSTYHVNVHATGEVRWKKRTPYTVFPMPTLPRFNPSLGPSRLISAAALLSNGLKSDQKLKQKCFSRGLR